MFLVDDWSYCSLLKLIDIPSPYCVWCDTDFVGQEPRVSCGDSGNTLLFSSVASGNDRMTYVQLAGRVAA